MGDPGKLCGNPREFGGILGGSGRLGDPRGFGETLGIRGRLGGPRGFGETLGGFGGDLREFGGP